MKKSQALEGVTRVADAGEEKFNELLEQSGFTDEDVVKYQEEKEKSEEEGSAEGGEQGEGNPPSDNDENTIPPVEGGEGGEGAPQNGADMAAAQAGIEGGAAPAMEIPPEAQQMGGGMEGGTPEMPPDAMAAQGGEEGGMTPDEEELLRQQQQAAQQ